MKKSNLLVLCFVAILMFGLGVLCGRIDDNAEILDINTLYENAVVDAMYAENDEVLDLVCLTEDSDMVTINEDGKVLLLTWNSSPDMFVAGSEVFADGVIWTFTDKEIIDWYSKNHEDIEDWQLRFNQLIGLQPTDSYTDFSAIWVDVDDIIRPAYNDDVAGDDMVLSMGNMDNEYRNWFEGNIVGSYYGEYLYPWTRLGYTYDWADNGTEYGLTEFLVADGAEIEVEYTMTTAEFLDYMDDLIEK